MSLKIDYERLNNDEHLLKMDSEAFSDIHINYTDIPIEKRDGTAVKLLGASTLYCFGATLGAALVTRGVDVKSLSGSVLVTKEKDEVRRTKVTQMTICMNVEIDDKDEAVLEKCRKIMTRGCFMTYTLEDSIDIEYEINRVKT